MPSTVRLHRVIKATPEKVYRAFTNADALIKWLPPYGFTASISFFDATVGGGYKMAFTNLTTGQSHSFEAHFTEMIPYQKLCYTDKFDDANLPGIMTVTVSFSPVLCGTELHVTQEGIPDMIPSEMCYLGWQESLDQLIKLIEPEIKE